MWHPTGVAGYHGLRHAGPHAGVFAGEHLIAAEVAAVSQNRDLLVSGRLLCLLAICIFGFTELSRPNLSV